MHVLPNTIHSSPNKPSNVGIFVMAAPDSSRYLGNCVCHVQSISTNKQIESLEFMNEFMQLEQITSDFGMT